MIPTPDAAAAAPLVLGRVECVLRSDTVFFYSNRPERLQPAVATSAVLWQLRLAVAGEASTRFDLALVWTPEV